MDREQTGFSEMTGKDFEVLITPSDLEIKAEDFDHIMTPESMGWTKTVRDNCSNYHVDKDEFSYSWEMPGIQMTFNSEMAYHKAKQIVDEIVKKLSDYSGKKVEANFYSTGGIIQF